MTEILISTMNDLPGYDVVEVHGEVFGLVVRARNAFSNIGASMRTLVGGEAKGYTSLLADSRNQAVARLRDAAGGHAARTAGTASRSSAGRAPAGSGASRKWIERVAPLSSTHAPARAATGTSSRPSRCTWCSQAAASGATRTRPPRCCSSPWLPEI